jgi:hypothetical protein
VSFEIGKTLGTNEPFYLDIPNIVTGRTFIASITRYGKSWSARKIVEECFGHAGIIVIDPEGEYISLREKYPFLIIGKDIPLQLETAEFMADKILEANISVIIDLSLTEVELGKEYVDKLLRRFFFLETTMRKPYLIIVEEAEEFGPEKGIATTTCLEILRNITKKGGKRGIGIVIIAHRPAWVSKGILSQCTNKAIGRIDWPSDLNVLEEFARIPKAAIEKLPTLDRGEFCFTGDWVKELSFVKVGQVKTTHLGFTPEVIPPSPKELKTVIESLQKALPEVIEKIKPTVVSTAEIESKIRSELEAKYKSKIEAILKTADEKAERKYKVRIDQLQEQLDKLSRAQALQPVAPIADPLEHPIVKTRMLELPDKARDLLIKVEREPGLTREQLAAFLTTSKDTVAGLVDKINRIFHATVIIGDGKPIRYKSMLKRLFITDVAKREIEEIERLQTINRELEGKLSGLAQQVTELQGWKQKALELDKEVLSLTKELEKSQLLNKTLREEGQKIKEEFENFKKIAKGAEAFNLAINIALEERLNTLKQEILKGTQVQIPPGTPIDEQKIEALIEEKLKNKIPASPQGFIPTSVELEHKVTHFDFQKPEEHIKADTTTLQGRIIYLITKGFFDTRHNRKEVVTELSNRGWVHSDKEVDDALLELCQHGIFYRKISTGNVFWYSLTPEAKQLIHEMEP